MNMRDLSLHGIVGSGKLRTGSKVGFDIKFKTTYQLFTQLTGLPSSRQYEVACDGKYFYYVSNKSVMRIDKKTGETSNLLTVSNNIQSICLSHDLQYIYILESQRLYKRVIADPSIDVFNVALVSQYFHSVFITSDTGRVWISSSSNSLIEARSSSSGVFVTTSAVPTEYPRVFILDDVKGSVVYGAQIKSYAYVDRYDMMAMTKSSYYTNISGTTNGLACAKDGIYIGITNLIGARVINKNLTSIYSTNFGGESIGTQYIASYGYDKEKGLVLASSNGKVFEVENFNIKNVTNLPSMGLYGHSTTIDPVDSTIYVIDNTGKFYQINTFREVI